MGRKKIQIEPLPESQIRAKFKKRKEGLKNKAYELGTLCGAQVALLVFSKDGEEMIDESVNGSVVEIFERYLRYLERGSVGQQCPSRAQQMLPAPQAGEPHVPLYQDNGMGQQQEMETNMNMPSTNTSDMHYEHGLGMPYIDANSGAHYGVFQGQDMSNYMPHVAQGGPQKFVPVAPSNVPCETCGFEFKVGAPISVSVPITVTSEILENL